MPCTDWMPRSDVPERIALQHFPTDLPTTMDLEIPTPTATAAPKTAVQHAHPTRRLGVDWSIAGPLLLAHALACLAPWTFSWPGLCLFVILYLVSGFGVTLGAHRYFTHGTFVARPWLRRMLAWMFLASAQGSLLRWVRDHHIHHRYSDQAGDPHSPQHEEGFWYAQLTWLWKMPPSRAENKRLYEQYVAKLGADPFLRACSRPSVLVGLHLGLITLAYALGALWQCGLAADFLILGWQTGISCVIWGIFLRIICVLHATSLVNSAAHLWGYRSYATPEQSHNNWWVALVSLGEGWHNNHHGRPAAANQGFHRWWEFDLSFCLLLLLGAVGALHDLRVYRARSGKTELWFRRPASIPNA